MIAIVSSQPHRPDDLERQELLERLFADLATWRRTIPAGHPLEAAAGCVHDRVCSELCTLRDQLRAESRS